VLETESKRKREKENEYIFFVDNTGISIGVEANTILNY